jgi:queuine tRNA-ribosyltransferase
VAGGFSFQILSTLGQARAGLITTPHGEIRTPAFMPVGTQATVKGLTPQQLAETGTQILLANTYHLLLRPGAEAVAQLGGLHRFMGWDAPILTDSGGFQVFSLARLRQLDDEGVEFQSHVDGALVRLTPETSINVQNQLGADVIMAFDECPPLPAEPPVLYAAVRRTLAWAQRSRAAHQRPDQALYGIIQGGLDLGLRQECLGRLVEIGFDGYALGGLSVGEPPPEMWQFLADFAWRLPANCPRYLMGVGTPRDLLEAVAAGIDQFDCVLPTRNGRKGYAFTSAGVLRLRNAAHRLSSEPLDAACDCQTCRNFSRGYLRHLFMSGEILGGTLVSLHNIRFYQNLMAQTRAAITDGTFDAFRRSFLASPACETNREIDE